MRKTIYSIMVGVEGRDMYVRDSYTNLAEAKKGFTYICKKEKEEISSWSLGKNEKLVVEIDKFHLIDDGEYELLDAVDYRFLK